MAKNRAREDPRLPGLATLLPVSLVGALFLEKHGQGGLAEPLLTAGPIERDVLRPHRL